MSSGLAVSTVYAPWEDAPTQRALRARQDVACRILAAGDARLVVFPAGYLWAPSARAVDQVAHPVIEAAERQGVAVVLGVDVRDPLSIKPRGKDEVDPAELDNWCIAWSPSATTAPSAGRAKWKQRSSTWWNGFSVPTPVEGQSLDVDGMDVEVLICGEIFSRPIRHNLLARRDEIDLVVVPAHTAQGSRHGRGLDFLATNGLPALRSVHAAHPAWLRWEFWLPGGSRPEIEPVYTGDAFVHARVARHNLQTRHA